MPRKRPRPGPKAAADISDVVPASEARTTETEVVIAPPSTVANRAILTMLTGLNAGQIYSVDRTHTVIGRGREAWVCIEAWGISRQHARIVKTGPGAFIIEDLGSTNGVYVNGERVETSPLAPGDQVQIGVDIVLRFSLVDAAQEALARQLFESSTRDALTGAFNRKYFMERLEAEVAYAERHRAQLALIMFDLDFFKLVNDTHGHVAGDAVLRNVGLSVARLLRAEDVFARYGGEEFALIVRGIASSNVRRLADRVRKTVADARVPWESTELSVTLSVGVAVLEESASEGATGLIARADSRLYRAKSSGRDCVVAE